MVLGIIGRHERLAAPILPFLWLHSKAVDQISGHHLNSPHHAIYVDTTRT